MSLQKHRRAVGIFAKAMRLVAKLQALPHKLTPPPFRLIQIGSGFWHSRALYVAARLDIATVLGHETLSAEAIATRVGAHTDAVSRLLRMLAAIGVFEETAAGVFRNNRHSRCLCADDAQSVRAMVLMHNSPTMTLPWFAHLEPGISSGTPPFQLAHGEDLFEHLDHHPEFDALFSQAMDSVGALMGNSFATDFDWEQFNRIIDVGGSRGTKSLAILQQHSHLRALVVDRPNVIEEAQRHWLAHPATGSDRLCFQPGDLLQSVPPAQDDKDIYLLAAVLHCFDDTTCRRAFNTLSEAVGSSGARIALMEMVLPETGADVAATSFDMQMFVCARGRERTLSEWQALAAESGLLVEEVVGLRSIGNILVLRRA